MALTMAILGGLGLFIITWWVIMMDGPSTAPNIISKIYRGYTFTPVGSLIGFVWAFIDGAFGGACLAWIYNSFVGNDQKKII